MDAGEYRRFHGAGGRLGGRCLLALSKAPEALADKGGHLPLCPILPIGSLHDISMWRVRIPIREVDGLLPAVPI